MVSTRTGNYGVMTKFDTEYTTLRDILSKLKPLCDEITQSIDKFTSLSNNDEITSLSHKVITLIESAGELTDDYSDIVQTIVDHIKSMSTDVEQTAQAALEKKSLDEHTKGVLGDSSLSQDPVKLISIFTKLEQKFDNRLHRAVKRVTRTAALSRLSLASQAPPSTVDTSHSDPAVSPTVSYTQSVASRSSVALPPMTIEPFDGTDITLWPSFFYQIKPVILENNQLRDAEKACYLRSSLKGRALSLIAAIPITDDYLSLLLSRLEEEYNDADATESQLLQLFESIKPKSSKPPDLLDAVRSLINIALSLRDSSALDNKLLLAQVAGRIHSRFVPIVFVDKPDKMITLLKTIETQLRNEIRMTELTNMFASSIPSSVYQSSPQSHSQSSSSSSPKDKSLTSKSTSQPRLTPPTKETCVFCGKHSNSTSCRTINLIPDRKKIVQEKRLCQCCLSSTHPSTSCTQTCSSCGEKHHASLCEAPSLSVNTLSATSHGPVRHHTRLPTLPVTLTNPDANQCQRATVLLDTGAQVSLISRDLVKRLELIPVRQFQASITGLDNENPVTTHDVVHVELTTQSGTQMIEAVVKESESAFGTIYYQPIPETDLDFVKDKLGSVPNHLSETRVNPDLLLGVNYTLRLLRSSEQSSLPSGFELVESVIGPMVIGAPSDDSPTCQETSSRPVSFTTVIVQPLPLTTATVLCHSTDTGEQRLVPPDNPSHLTSDHLPSTPSPPPGGLHCLHNAIQPPSTSHSTVNRTSRTDSNPNPVLASNQQTMATMTDQNKAMPQVIKDAQFRQTLIGKSLATLFPSPSTLTRDSRIDIDRKRSYHPSKKGTSRIRCAFCSSSDHNSLECDVEDEASLTTVNHCVMRRVPKMPSSEEGNPHRLSPSTPAREEVIDGPAMSMEPLFPLIDNF